MKPSLTSLLTLRRSAVIALVALSLTGAMRPSARAADVVWNNMAGNFLWNTTELNWSTGAWNNAAGNGALFGNTGAGTLNLTEAINVNSLNFTAGNYTLGGVGPLNFVTGTSTLGYGFINTEAGVTATINNAINTNYIIKLGAGVLELGGPMNFSGDGFAIDARGVLRGDLIVGGGSDGSFNPIFGGTIRIMNTSVLPATTRVGISNGVLDIGANNTTIAALTFINQANSNNTALYNPATGIAGVGVTGSGTLRVTGDISVLGVGGGNFESNLVGSNLDLGGGTQVVRTASNGQFSLARAVGFTGVLSNGSLLHTFGVTENGIMGNPDGMALYGNNTYTGSTTLNGGPTIMTGTNATTLVRLVGDRGASAPNLGNSLTLQGANGSLGGATMIQAVAGGAFIIDNNVALPAGSDVPAVAAAQNNNRIRDDAEMQLRDGFFVYRGLAATAGSETFGNLNLLGGHNNVTLTPGSGGGTVSVTANGNLTLAPRATLQVSSATLGAASKFFINGTTPTADATGILSHVVSSTDFVTYNGTTGLTNYTGYATDFNTAGTNVFTNAAASVASSVAVNAIKSSGTVSTTIAAGQTLGVTSGMLLNISGTRTYTGGTIAFGSNPGVLFDGTTASGGFIINSAITGSAGLINANTVSTLNGDMSGLTGTLTNDIGNTTTNLATNTFAGAIEVRGGTLNLNTSQTLAGQGAITLGVLANDAHLMNNFATVGFAGAGNGAIIGRDIIVDIGSLDAAGLAVTFGFIPSLTPLNNNLGSQTLSGNLTLNSPTRLQGGSGAGMGSTTLSGNISGPSQFFLSNGRDLLTGNYSNAGGFRIGEGGFTAQVSFLGTPVGNAPIVMEGGNSTYIAYNAGSLPTGPITIENTNASGIGTSASINPLQNSTINNAIILGSTITPGTVLANVVSGVTANWAGPISGAGGLIKVTGTGTLNLSGLETYAGATSVNAGTLGLDYSTNNTTKLADGAALNLGGGTLNLSGGSHTEVVASTTLNAGGSSVTRSSGASVLQMNGITRNIGSTVNFGAGNIANTDTNNAGGFGILGGYATVGATGSADWAKSTNSGAADTAVTAFTTYDSFATSGSDNNNPLLTGSSALTGNLTTNSLKINTSGAGQSLDVVAGQTLALNTGGLLFTGAQDYQINNGTLKSNSAANSELIVQQYGAGNLTINSVIANGNGPSTLTKAGSGTLTLGAAANTYTGANVVNAGALVINGSNAATQNVINGGTLTFNSSSASTQNVINGGTIVFNGSNAATSGNTINAGTMLVNGTTSGTTAVNNGGTLGGIGSLTSAVTVQSGGTLSPGSSIGTFAIGAGTGRQLTLSGTFLAEINLNNGGAPSADLLNLTGTFGITGGILSLSLSNIPAAGINGTYLLVNNDAADAISGTFIEINGLPAGVTATAIYNFTGTDSLGRIGTGNDLAITIVPEPTTYGLIAMGVGGMLLLRRRRRA